MPHIGNERNERRLKRSPALSLEQEPRTQRLGKADDDAQKIPTAQMNLSATTRFPRNAATARLGRASVAWVRWFSSGHFPGTIRARTGRVTSPAPARFWIVPSPSMAKISGGERAPTRRLPPPKGGPEAKAAGADETAHDTQMVWGKSTMIGFGLATTKDGRVVVVAKYNPRGNLEGEKPY